MAQQKQAQQAAQAAPIRVGPVGVAAAAAPGQQLAFPNLPAPVSSASSLNSNNSVSSNVSPTPNASVVGGTAPAMASNQLQLVQPQQQQVVQAQQPAPAPATTHAQLLTYTPSLDLTSPAVANPPPQGQVTNPLLNLGAFGTAATAAALLPGGSVPEFLYQLTKMLTDNNRDIIEWSTYSGNGRIEVHHPGRLEKEVLGRYFRHSKYSSFQRQLNYFGFRKIAGKGKMSPCSYVNEAATTDIRSLLLMKRKNSKEKERELQEQRERELAEAAAAGGDVAVSGLGMATRSQKKRSNPGDDIQPATVRPMFNTSAATATVPATAAVAGIVASGGITRRTSIEEFNAMAANVARNIATNSSSTITEAARSHLPATAGLNKRAKVLPHRPLAASSSSTIPATTTSSSSTGIGYKVAIGKGLRHKFNGYLRSNSTNAATAALSSTATASTATSSSNKYNSYLSHPSAKLASSTPAPLQFLDPSELGMSIENSLSQLKDNFAAAAGGVGNASTVTSSAAATAAAESASSSKHASSSTLSSSATAGASNAGRDKPANAKFAPSALTRRVSSTTFLGGMLSRDDSLINLAMLPTLDSDATDPADGNVNNADGSATAAGGGGGTNDIMSGIFSRDDSLVNLAAAVEAVESADRRKEAGNSGDDGSGSDTFGFIDFQS